MEVFIKPKLKTLHGTKLTTVDTLVSVPCTENGDLFFTIRGYKSKLLILSAATNTLVYTFDVSNDASVWFNKTAETDLLTTTPQYIVMTEIWRYCRVQVKPKVAATHGTITATLECSSL